MIEKKTTRLFKFIKWILYKVYPKIESEGTEFIPKDEPCIFVGNHCQINGPIACELFFPIHRYTWCAGQMMKLKEVPAYAFMDFWSGKPRWTHLFFKAVSILIAPLSVCVFGNANTIPVYRDSRVLGTFKTTIKMLTEGENIVIFPEHNKLCNNIVYDFQDKFIDIARLYYKKTKKNIKFVPFYVAPKIKKMYFGAAIEFNGEKDMDSQRAEIKEYLMKSVTELGVNAPLHTVVPYRNIKKKDYPKNKPLKEYK